MSIVNCQLEKGVFDTEDAQLPRMEALAKRLLDRLEQLVEGGDLDYATIKQICATMKDLKDLIQPKGKATEKEITVTLGQELEKLSR